jgi:hypothetical protein
MGIAGFAESFLPSGPIRSAGGAVIETGLGIPGSTLQLVSGSVMFAESAKQAPWATGLAIKDINDTMTGQFNQAMQEDELKARLTMGLNLALVGSSLKGMGAGEIGLKAISTQKPAFKSFMADESGAITIGKSKLIMDPEISKLSGMAKLSTNERIASRIATRDMNADINLMNMPKNDVLTSAMPGKYDTISRIVNRNARADRMAADIRYNYGLEQSGGFFSRLDTNMGANLRTTYGRHVIPGYSAIFTTPKFSEMKMSPTITGNMPHTRTLDLLGSSQRQTPSASSMIGSKSMTKQLASTLQMPSLKSATVTKQNTDIKVAWPYKSSAKNSTPSLTRNNNLFPPTPKTTKVAPLILPGLGSGQGHKSGITGLSTPSRWKNFGIMSDYISTPKRTTKKRRRH